MAKCISNGRGGSRPLVWMCNNCVVIIAILLLCDITRTTSEHIATTNNDTTVHKNVNPVLTVTPHDLPITIDSVDDVFFINTSVSLQEPIDIYLLNDYTGIATVSQTVTIKAQTTGVSVQVKSVDIGSCTITLNATNFYKYTHQNESVSSLFIRIHVSRSFMVSLLSQVAGWFYMICWAVLLLPQIHLNYQLHSVVGLSFDYLVFSVVSYAAFAIYNMMSFWNADIREAYLSDAPIAPGVDIVHLKDVVFSIVNVIFISVTCLQCVKYERGDQKVSIISKVLIGIIKTVLLVLVIIVVAWDERVLSLDTLVNVIVFLKLSVTFAKYVPQVYMNYSRKSTEGWSVSFAILDLICGVLLLLEMLLVAYNYGNWISFKHSPTRVCNSVFSMLFGTIFIVQHFVLYRMIMDEDTIPILGSGFNNKSIQEPENGYGGHVASSASDKEMVTLSSKDE